MELEAQYKTVTVPRTVLPMADGGVPESANRPPGINIPRTPGYGAPQTPAYGAGNRTPMHAWGSRTPMHPGMTPSHPGSAVSPGCLPSYLLIFLRSTNSLAIGRLRCFPGVEAKCILPEICKAKKGKRLRLLMLTCGIVMPSQDAQPLRRLADFHLAHQRALSLVP